MEYTRIQIDPLKIICCNNARNNINIIPLRYLPIIIIIVIKTKEWDYNLTDVSFVNQSEKYGKMTSNLMLVE